MDIHVTAWPGTPRILAMSLKSVPDFLTDEDHARMDEAVKEAMENWPIVDVLLLGEIVARSEGQLNQKYKEIDNVKALIKENPELSKMLKTAWEKRQFRDIRNLGAISVKLWRRKPSNANAEILCVAHNTARGSAQANWESDHRYVFLPSVFPKHLFLRIA
jgi:hypothetical protein